MAYHYDEEKQKYVYDNKPPEGEKKEETHGKQKPAGGIAYKYDQYMRLKKWMENKLGRWWWLWLAIAIGIVSNLVKYLKNILENFSSSALF